MLEETLDEDEFNKAFIARTAEEKRIGFLITQINSSLNNEPKHTACPRNELKLPTLKLPQFDGTLANWDSFWDQFSASIDCRKGLSPVDK